MPNCEKCLHRSGGECHAHPPDRNGFFPPARVRCGEYNNGELVVLPEGMTLTSLGPVNTREAEQEPKRGRGRPRKER